jgi:hypothetical protein
MCCKRDKIEEIGVLLELDTQLAASLFSQIGSLEADHSSEIGKRVCRQIGQMGAELALENNSDIQNTSANIIRAFTSIVDKPVIHLPGEEETGSEKEERDFCAWEAPEAPESTIRLFPTNGPCGWKFTSSSKRVLRDDFATEDECARLLGLSILLMTGNY